MMGGCTAFGEVAFVPGRLTEVGKAAGGVTGTALRALLDRALAVATVVSLIFVAAGALVLADFFVVNL